MISVVEFVMIGVCVNISSVIMPEGLLSIGYSAFMYCANLASVNIPNSVKWIGHEAFSDCVNLTNVTIPDGVKMIGYNAFYNCKSLTSITIPDSVTGIGEQAFGYGYVQGKHASVIPAFVIIGGKDTAAQKYARDNGIIFLSPGNSQAPAAFGDINGSGGKPDVEDLVLMQKIVAVWNVLPEK